jgi:hypothetical protein
MISLNEIHKERILKNGNNGVVTLAIWTRTKKEDKMYPNLDIGDNPTAEILDSIATL